MHSCISLVTIVKIVHANEVEFLNSKNSNYSIDFLHKHTKIVKLPILL